MNASLRHCVLLLLAAGCLLPTFVHAANRCTDTVRTGSAATDRLPPLANIAGGVIEENLVEAKSRDLIQAIATLQQNQFSMVHPQASQAQRQYAFFQVRCASEDSYRALNDQIRARVRAAQSQYRKQRWFIGTPMDLISMHAQDPAPGLLNLLVMANLYDEFEQEAVQFLNAAVGDNEAAAHFKSVNRIAESRRRFLTEWDERYTNTSYGAAGIGLLAEERAGLTKLENLEARLEPLREAHIEFWLQSEQQSFAELLARPSNDLLDLQGTMQADTAVEQLRLALNIARPAAKEPITTLAHERGQTLVDAERFTEAADYFKLAGADAEADRAIAANNARLDARSAALTKSATELRDTMMKSDAERESFEDETDALADELGIDLDDF